MLNIKMIYHCFFVLCRCYRKTSVARMLAGLEMLNVFLFIEGKQDYKKTKSALKMTRLKAEAKKSGPGIRDAFLVILAVLVFMLCVYAFFYLNLSTELDMDLDVD
uniref:Triple QxxK/R motif-containing protein n=1 Tax=Salmo trutta TaxID=8032 RepID=A0A674CJB5_SALTR